MQVSYQRWLERLTERLPDYTSLLLVIVCGFLLARSMSMFFPTNAPTLKVDTGNTPVANLSTTTPNPADQLANFNLFGRYEPQATAVQPTAPVQTSQLALKLTGLYALPGRKGYAIIEENGKQQAYGVGKTIGSSGAILEQVLPDSVLIRRNGGTALEKLTLPRLSLATGKNAPASGAGMSMTPDSAPPVDEASMQSVGDMPVDMPPPEMFTPTAGAVPPPPSDAPPAPMNNVTPPSTPPAPTPNGPDANNLGAFRQSVMNNNMKLLEVISPQPYERDGKFLGFQLTPGSNIAMFNQLGLQAGDIVTAINGTVLDSPATAMQVLQGASTANQVNLTISRNGQEISLPLNF